jgi:NTE family protein
MSAEKQSCALVLTGGGARAAYQVGVLRCIARRFPEAKFDIITGVSAGAINAVFLASRSGPLAKIVADLDSVWRRLQIRDVMRIDTAALVRNVIAWGTKLISGGAPVAPRVRGLVDTTPLRQLLDRLFPLNADGEIAGLAESLRNGDPDAVAVTTLDYTTGRTVTWVEGSNIIMWERPLRRSVLAKISVDHIMASAALPVIFPAVKLQRHWYGDGGIRLSAPLAPALHLGATRMLAISTHYEKTFSEADEPQTIGYPPLAQILGQLANSVFLDVIDEDAIRLQRSNELLRELPADRRHGFRLVEFANIRPSQDLGKIAAEYEPQLPRAFRFLTRSLGTRETSNADFLSLLMFIPDYLRRLIDIGDADAEKRIGEIGKVIPAT